MEHQEPDRKVVYHAKMEALYTIVVAMNIFKQQYFPADPFDGVLIGVEYLEVAELVVIFRAAKALEDEGNAAFVQNLVLYRGEHSTPMLRVNQLWLDSLRQRKREICEYIHNCFFEGEAEIEGQQQLILNANDPQLVEYLYQADEALACEVEVDSPTILIEQEAV